MRDFYAERESAALAMPNRGPLELTVEGDISPDILKSYREQGFYVFENVIDDVEMNELRTEFEALLDRSPSTSEATTDARGRALEFDDVERRMFRFVRPLSDPYGGTDTTNSRYQVKLTEPPPPDNAPKEVLLQIGGILQFLNSALRIYAHPDLLRMAAAVNGPDFTPFNEVIWLKQQKVGAAVAWHQDGTTHWDSETLDAGTHGFNFMLNIHPTSPANALWVVPKTHDSGKADIKSMVSRSESEYIDGAVPLLCRPGDIAIVNRQLVHGSFPNQSDQPRYTFVFGFHRRSSVLGVQGWAKEPYDDDYIARSSRIISLGIAARSHHRPDEHPFVYQPAIGTKDIGWGDGARQEVLRNYHQRAIGI